MCIFFFHPYVLVPSFVTLWYHFLSLKKIKAREEISVLCPLCVLFFSFSKFKKAGERNKEKMLSLLLFASALEEKERVVK
jgi:hypothetical protein